MRRTVPLEPAAEQVCEQSAIPPLIYQLPPEQGRTVLEQAQDTPVCECPARVETISFELTGGTSIPVYLIQPVDCAPRNVIFYIHGAGWVFGSFHTHRKLVRELAARTGSLIVFPEYTRSPEVRYPVAIEQCYQVLSALPYLVCEHAPQADLNTLLVAGDSVGGNMATVMTLLAKERCGPRIAGQLLYYPVTDACFQTASYQQFACGYYLYRAGMKWFWDQYLPNEHCRRQITASPLRATLEQLRGLPEAMIINGEADVLRYEGEAYAKRLRLAGVKVTAIRIQETIHDFVMLNALDQTEACRTAMDASTAWINQKNKANR